jgi:hypothetical protein
MTDLKLRLKLAFTCTVLGTIVTAGAAAAQTTPPAPPPSAAPVVTARLSNTWVAGNITITGIAVDCTSGQPATRVAIYDGPDPTYPYVADVSMDTTAQVGSACPGRSGTGRIGYTVIYNSRLLGDGQHFLTFWAEYPNGAAGSTVLPLFVENTLPFGTNNNGWPEENMR